MVIVTEAISIASSCLTHNMHPSQTYSYLQKLDRALTRFVKRTRQFFRKKRQMLPLNVGKITFQVEISLLQTDYFQLSYYDGENRKGVIKEFFGKKNKVYFEYLNKEDVPDYFKIFINSKSDFEICTISILSSEGSREIRFEIARNYPYGKWFFCYLSKSLQ